MRQIWIPRAGPPEVLALREARDPLPGPGHVRIRVEASGVNFADIMGRMGMYPDLPPMPCVPGYEVAGRVDALGAGSFRERYRSLAPTGRLGMFGLSAAATGKRRNLLRAVGPALRTAALRFSAMKLIDENKGVFGVNLGHLWEEMDRLTGWFEELMTWHREGAIRPVIAAVFPFERAADAHHYLQDRKNFGKVLLTP